jgi:hypothetical protein
MSCEYCTNNKTMIRFDAISRSNWAWGYDDAVKLTLREAEDEPVKMGVFVDDRGYIRFADLDDCSCLDHSEKIKIRFCPMCGVEMGEQ